MKSPRGFDIVGTFEVLYGVAQLIHPKIVDNKIEFDYEGDTEVDWNSQTTVLDKKGRRIFVDAEGFHWSENEVIEANKKG